MNIKLFKKGDIIVALCMITICAVLWGFSRFSGGALIAEIIVDGTEYSSIDLNAVEGEYTIQLDTVPEVTIGVENGAVWFESSDCADKLCEKQGKLTRRGSVAACLPARVVVTIAGEGAVDAETY